MRLAVNIITYNGASAFLEEAIKSVLPYVKEILVYDTGSGDDTIELLKKYFIQFERRDIQHLGETWTNSPKDMVLTDMLNQMKNKTRADWILKIDDDEIMPKVLMEEILETIKEPKGLIYSLPFIHISPKFQPKMKYHYIKRLFRNVPQVSWQGVYGQETLTLGGKRIPSEKCPKLLNPFLHLGGLRKDVAEREHRYENL